MKDQPITAGKALLVRIAPRSVLHQVAASLLGGLLILGASLPRFFRYLAGVWRCRHFWLHLVRAELRARYRRSKLGIVWAILSPLLLTLMISWVMGSIFEIPMKRYAPYIFSGFITWEVLSGSVTAGCTSLVSADAYIRQKKLPLAIYPLRTTLSIFVNFLFALSGLVLWMLITDPGRLGLPMVSLFASLPLLAAIGWSLAVPSSFLAVVFRDFHFLAPLMLQLLWYFSPVFIETSVYRQAHLDFVLDYNPIAHVLNLIRAPLMDGNYPTFVDYTWSVALLLLFTIVSGFSVLRLEKKAIFYL